MGRGSRTRVRVAALLACATVMAACGDAKSSNSEAGGEESSSTSVAGRVPTRQELSRLAGTLAKNTQLGGAHFTATVSNEEGGNEVAVTGDIDWSASDGTTGAGTVTFTFSDGRPRETMPVWWHSGTNPTVILPTTEDQRTQLVASGLAAFPYGAVVPDPGGVPLHTLLQFINAGASNRAENPTLLEQNGSVSFLRHDRVGSREVDVFQFGANTKYWVGRTDGVLYRFQADAQSLGALTVTYSKHEQPTITLPEAADVASIAQMNALLEGN